MAEIVVVGGGLVGHCAAMLLAADGHAVTMLERDPQPPPGSGDAAWDDWTRRGVNQFHMIHYFLPRFRDIVERELPEVAAALDADGTVAVERAVIVEADPAAGAKLYADMFGPDAVRDIKNGKKVEIYFDTKTLEVVKAEVKG